MGMILRIASSRIVGQGDIVGRSGYFSLNLSANSVMRGRLDARRTLKSLVADLRIGINHVIPINKPSGSKRAVGRARFFHRLHDVPVPEQITACHFPCIKVFPKTHLYAPHKSPPCFSKRRR